MPDLDALLARATSAAVRTVDGEPVHHTTDAAALAGLREALAVEVVLDMVCACLGDLRIEFAGVDGVRIATVGYHHAATIRWDGYPADAELRDGPALLRWLAAQGVPGPLERHETGERARAAHEAERAIALRDWRAKAPLPDAILDRIVEGRPPATDALLAEVRAGRDTAPAVALALLAWCGAGTGRYSGYPSHEALPSRLLAEIPIGVIVEALGLPEATDAHRAGAVRHLIGWRSRAKLARDIGRVPAALRARLVEVARRSPDPDTRERAAEKLG
ncbi:hypothetical protein Val02_51310 [Virgisporangium aliadipatigenens]|uniref:Uncharacterized protein n=1 Tax=Virgisporangium aliadipatigenens TaxID=741659 RepID=A0A8J3YQR9_9ACTN|nr:hypothetical protein [Virgisporangium aliadipatigenens]GIJ48245.1 hypothetical protein Val02_51310 [Virgisporangium aliadipatigenens]